MTPSESSSHNLYDLHNLPNDHATELFEKAQRSSVVAQD